MEAKDCRKVAREALAGNWGYAVALTILFGIVSMVCLYVPYIGLVAWLLLSLPFSYVFGQCFLNVKRGNKIDISDFFVKPFNIFSKCWSVYLHMILKLLPYIIMIIIGVAVSNISILGGILFDVEVGTGLSIAIFLSLLIGIVGLLLFVTNSFYYVIVQFIILDNPTMSGKEVVNKSKQMMKGERMRYFYLQLTFIGWSILASFTCGIGNLWLTPYMSTAFGAFYDDLLEEENEEAVDAIVY